MVKFYSVEPVFSSQPILKGYPPFSVGDGLLQDCSTVITTKQLLFALKLHKGGYFIFS